MPIEKDRYDELNIDGKVVTCPECDESFPIQHHLTTGGGFGMIGLKCPGCWKNFGIVQEKLTNEARKNKKDDR